jgi:hypothetical protein
MSLASSAPEAGCCIARNVRCSDKHHPEEPMEDRKSRAFLVNETVLLTVNQKLPCAVSRETYNFDHNESLD